MYRKLLISIVLAGLFVPLARADSLAALAGPAGMIQPVDRVVVDKSSRRMELYRGGAVVASYKVSLGLVPSGQKQREGDFRTPEGSYRLTRRNAQSDFFLAVQVSYPEAADVAIARRNGWAPGGAIMVHMMKAPPITLPASVLVVVWIAGFLRMPYLLDPLFRRRSDS